MRALYTQFSALAGLLAFLNQLWSYAPIERTILIGFGTGLGVYLVLMLGDVAIHHILTQAPRAVSDEAAGGRKESGETAPKKHNRPEARAA